MAAAGAAFTVESASWPSLCRAPTVLNGILWRLKTGAPWRDVPERYGAWQTCYDRFVRWSRNGTWQRILSALQAQADASGHINWDGAALGSTHIKAHRSATGARRAPAKAERRGAYAMNGWGVPGAAAPPRFISASMATLVHFPSSSPPANAPMSLR